MADRTSLELKLPVAVAVTVSPLTKPALAMASVGAEVAAVLPS